MVYRRFYSIFIVCVYVLLAVANTARSEYPPTMILKFGNSGSSDGLFNQPHGIAADTSGNIYVADTDNHRIQKFGSTGTFLAKWGSSGSGSGQFNKPYGVAVDSSGNIYVADTGNNRIQKLTSTGIYITSWGSSGSSDGQFSSPSGIAADSAGNVYVADTYNHRIQKFTTNGAFILKWGIFGTGDAQLNMPFGITTDSSGNIWVADTGNNRIQKFGSTGTFAAKWGGFGTDNGLFKSPVNIATDSSGSVYVTDKDNNRLQKFNGTGTFLSAWGGYGSTDGLFIQPWGIATDNTGNIYAADKDNNRIKKFAYVSRVISVSGDMAFGNIAVGTSTYRTLTISNTGNSTLTVSSISYPSGFSGNWSGTIAAGSYQSVTVTFTPTAAQSYSGTLTVNSDKTSGTETISLSGTGIQNTRIISLSGDMAFGNVSVGTSVQRTLTISNTGNSVLTVSSISYPTGFSGSWIGAIFSGTWNGTIAAGSYQNITVTFTPTAAQIYSGTIVVSSDKTSGTETISLSGTGIQNTRMISLSGDMAFGNVYVGSSAQKTLTISNTGNSTLTVYSISYPTGFSGSWSGTIAAGSYQNVSVMFTPTAAQTYSGTIVVSSDKTSGIETRSISGTGIPIQTGISAIRSFPCYLAGNKLTVSLTVQPSSGIGLYAVEDRQPSGWTVSNISNSGVYDSVSGKIKFGPFFDNSSRTLTYDVTPPITDSGDKSFSGIVSADGVNTAIIGSSVISTCFNHPADINPNDFTLNIGEVTAYGLAWKNGTSWSVPPNPIPISYVTRAGALWQGGETYRFDSTAGAAPMCWVNTLAGRSVRSSESSAIRQIPESYETENEISITIDVSPSSDVRAYAVEDQPPEGWEVTSVDSNGQFDSANRKVRFGLFLDNQQRTLSYQVRPSTADTSGFAGVASFDGSDVHILSKREPCDNDRNLQDVIVVLQVLSGITPVEVCLAEQDMNNDQKLGLEDVIYLLQIIAGLR